MESLFSHYVWLYRLNGGFKLLHEFRINSFLLCNDISVPDFNKYEKLILLIVLHHIKV